jgi:transcriptional regulator with XRE-family HTH domain
MEETLGKVIADFRKRKVYNQSQLAKKFDKSKQWLGAIEVGKGTPTLEQLLKLHEELVSKDNQTPESDLGNWLLKWLEKRVNKDVDINNKEAALNAIDKLYKQSNRAARTRSASAVPTLEDFPYGFESLIIICGDRRESPPKSKGDFFVDAFSSADLASLKTLLEKTGPLEIRSDKLFMSGNRSSGDYLKQLYGQRNLIVIGSPAVNLVARAINRNAVFRFATSEGMPEFLKYWEEEFPEINDRKLREIFWDMASKWNGSLEASGIDTNHYYEESGRRIHPGQIEELARKVGELLTSHTVKDVKASFHKYGFIDPVANKEQGYFLMEDNDFGVISLCPNPYSDGGNYFCILAAGTHGPGTDMAVRVLATDPDGFREHPLGGVVEVKLDLEARWSERFSTADFEWQTGKYTVNEELLGKLRNPKPGSILSKYEEGDLRGLTDFIQRFVGNNNAV